MRGRCVIFRMAIAPAGRRRHGTRFDHSSRQSPGREKQMLWTIFVVLMVLWLLGVSSAYTLGGFIHILLLLALASVLIQIIQGRRVV
jgi:uncharacterized protein DUF5670